MPSGACVMKLGNANRPAKDVAVFPVEDLQAADGLLGNSHLRFCAALAKLMGGDNSEQQHGARIKGCTARLGCYEHLL